MNQNQKKAYFYAGCVIFFWSTVSSVFKLSLRYIDSYQLLLYSSLSSMFVLLILIIKTNKFRELFKRSKKEYFIIFVMGLLNPFLYFIFLFKAYELLPAQEAQPITYTWPVIMVFLSAMILKQKISRFDIFSLLVCYAGILIVVTKGAPSELRITDTGGFLFAIMSTFIWALYWIINTKINIEPVITLFLNFLFAFPFIVLICFYKSFISADYYGVAGAFYVGVFEMGLAFVFWLKALKLAERKSLIINLTYLSPVFSLIFIQALTGEKIIFPTVIGLILIILGIFIQNCIKLRFLK